MKKKIATILFIGVIALISMGFRSQSAVDGFSNGSKIKIIKGEVISNDKDKYWDYVTFGLEGLDSDEYGIAVEILDKKGELVDWFSGDDITDLDGKKKGVSWYSIDLNKYKIKNDFTLEVHLIRNESGISGVLSTMASKVKGDSPIDPDETVLILKYP